MGNITGNVNDNISEEYKEKLFSAINNSNERYVKCFDCLCDDGKILFLDGMVIGAAKHNHYEPHLFIRTLKDTGRLNSELVKRCDNNFSLLREYFDKNVISTPDIIIKDTEMHKNIEDKIKELKLLDYIGKYVRDFIEFGNYNSYALIYRLRLEDNIRFDVDKMILERLKVIK
ncbi:SWPV1-246 [Shearwaterpox virus]|uniref:SWPV1-246 n=1 Tax=Shearwaterpox virus TaxID=1974596 RepID=A0A1V0S865_CNPV|nr:SWPV1-246 [Shearwaterpox virus]